MTFYFYIARCSDDSLYCGSCKDLALREKTHNDGKGAKYTRSRRPIHIIYSEPFDSRGAALKRELEVKKWPKTQKETLVGS